MISLEFRRCFKNIYFVEHRQTASSEISSKNQVAAVDKFLEAVIRIYFSKWVFLKIDCSPLLGSLFNKVARLTYSPAMATCFEYYKKLGHSY